MPFLGWSGVINITLGRASYYVAMHHGVGGGRMRGGKANNLERFESIYPGADLYIEGHTHTYQAFVNEVNYLGRKRNLLAPYPATFCTTGAFLNWKDSYGEEFKYRPGVKGCAVMHLKHCGTGNFSSKNIRCELFN